jgi:pyruvate dehydrogenase E1 component
MKMEQKEKQEIWEVENQEWLDSINYIIKHEDPERVREIMALQSKRCVDAGIDPGLCRDTPYINTIPADREQPYPGDRSLERKIKSLVRWNAMAMVVQANKKKDGIGGHISTYASCATLFEVGFNHFFRGSEGGNKPDIVYFQGHASPGVYARSFLEGRLNETHLHNFRRELAEGGGLSSYPHPRLMPDYWQFPTVSMGLSPIMAIYQARFSKYLHDKGLLDTEGQKVWAFLGDGEMDEPEAMGALTLAAREELDNLIFVVNCNLQRLDGPVRGNGSIIKELSMAFRGAGWNVIKVIWGENWDPLLEKDKNDVLKKRLGELVDGQLQKYSTMGGDYIREDFFGKSKELLAMVEDMSDEDIANLRRGGHDPVKVYNAYLSAVNHKGSPSVILAQTIKGYGLGEAGEGKNITHQQKKLNEDELEHFRRRFDVPVSEEDAKKAPFFRPDEDSDEIRYLKEKRKELGGFIPERRKNPPDFKMPEEEVFREFMEGSGIRDVATTMAAVRLLSKLLQDEHVGKMVVPIVPDESRTFGMEALFKQAGIYSRKGQLYEPVDRKSLLYYNEEKDGAILEEGITEAGCMSSFIAAGTSYSTHGIYSIPFFAFYSMFGFQRVGDLIWAAADARARGFMLGGTSGRTTLAGEGLQHQDGHSHLLATTVPCVRAYDPAFAYEIAVIIREGMRKMFVEGEDLIYYITMMNEKYRMPPVPKRKGIEEGVIKGMYRYRSAQKNTHNLHLLGSGTILNEALKAAEILKKKYQVAADVWSVTSYKQLYDNARETERSNRLDPGKRRKSYIEECVGTDDGIFVAATDYVKSLPLSVSGWFPGTFTALGTDGFGLSEDREHLREYFEVNANHIAWAGLVELFRGNKIERKVLNRAKGELGIKKDKQYPRSC